LGREPATDPYLRAAVAFARMAEAGMATLNHCHNTADPTRLVEEAEAVSRAARDVGVRVAFAVPISGRNPLTYGDPGPLLSTPAHRQAEALRNRPRAAHPGRTIRHGRGGRGFEHELFHVQYGPVGPQWVDDAMLARRSPRPPPVGRRVHMHLFETPIRRNGPKPPIPAAC
jgi:5-methylthioadenosine/S-adenosylhomocysteine deaminase